MCGRFVVSYSLDELKQFLSNAYDIFDLDETMYQAPNYNVSPTQNVLAITKDNDKYNVVALRWGLIPSYIRDLTKSYSMFNARSETVEEKRSFKYPFHHNRCLILANGFYEWDKQTKKPYYITTNQPMFAFAGIYTINKNFSNYIKSCSILTTDSNAFMKEIHDRMPIILTKEDALKWLDKSDEYKLLLNKYDSNLMNRYQVSKEVNNVKNNHKGLLHHFEEYTLF